MFWLYNKDDIKGTHNGFDTIFLTNNSPISLKNYQIGIRTSYFSREWFGVDLTLLFQNFNQDYDGYNKIDFFPTHTNINSQLDYFALIISPMFNITGNRNTISYFISPGFSYHFLTDYTLTRSYYLLKKNQVAKAFEYGNGTYYSYDENGVLLGESTRTSRYNKNLFGICSRLGTRIDLYDKIVLEFSLDAQYTVTNTDNLEATAINKGSSIVYKLWDNQSSIIPTLNPRSKSHNIYCGLGLSVLYRFGERY
jgi:hypothetical protein